MYPSKSKQLEMNSQIDSYCVGSKMQHIYNETRQRKPNTLWYRVRCGSHVVSSSVSFCKIEVVVLVC